MRFPLLSHIKPKRAHKPKQYNLELKQYLRRSETINVKPLHQRQNIIKQKRRAIIKIHVGSLIKWM